MVLSLLYYCYSDCRLNLLVESPNLEQILLVEHPRGVLISGAAHGLTDRCAVPALPKPGSLGRAQTIRRVVLSAPLVSPGRSLL